MNGLPQEPIPELTTTRTGGGRSARLIAAGITVVLVAAVFTGLSGKQTNNAVPPIDAAVVTTATPAVAVALPSTAAPPTAAAPTAAPVATPYPGAAEVVDDPRPAWPFTWVAVALRIGGTLALADLYDDEPGHLHGTFSVPLPVPTDTATLELFEVGRAYESETYGKWGIPMEVFDPNMPPQARLVDEVHGPNRFIASPPIVANGYRIVAIGERRPEGGIINVDITVGSNPTYPGGTFMVVAGAWGKTLEATVNQDAPGRLSGQIVFPDSIRSSTADLLLRGSDPANFLSGEHLAELTVALPGKADFVPGASAFSVAFDPDPLAPGRMTIVNAGFQFDGTYELVKGKRAVSFRIRMNPTYEVLAGQNDALVEHNWVTGDDGLIGWPSPLSPTR